MVLKFNNGSETKSINNIVFYDASKNKKVIGNVFKGSKLVYSKNFGALKFLDSSNNLFQPNTTQAQSVYDGVKVIGEDCLAYLCKDRYTITSVIGFESLTTIEKNGLGHAFDGCYGINNSVNFEQPFPALTEVKENGLQYAYQNCSGLSNLITFDNLTKVGQNGLFACFRNCTSLDKSGFADNKPFQSLEEIDDYGLKNCFYGCSKLSTYAGTLKLTFSKLHTLGSFALENAFNGVPYFEEVRFNELYDVQLDSLEDAFSGCNVHKIYFLKAVQSKIEALNGYEDKFSADDTYETPEICWIEGALLHLNGADSTTMISVGGADARNSFDYVAENKADVTLVAYKDNTIVTSKTITDISANNETTLSIDVSTATSKTLTLNTSVADCSCVFEIGGVEFSPFTSTSTSHSITLGVGTGFNNCEVKYTVKKDGYMDVEGTSTISDDLSLNIVMQQEFLDNFDYTLPNYVKQSNVIETSDYFYGFDTDLGMTSTIPSKYVDTLLDSVEIQAHMKLFDLLSNHETFNVLGMNKFVMSYVCTYNNGHMFEPNCSYYSQDYEGTKSFDATIPELYQHISYNSMLYNNILNRESRELWVKMRVEEGKQAKLFISFDGSNFEEIGKSTGVVNNIIIPESNVVTINPGKNPIRLYKEGTYIKINNHYAWKFYTQNNTQNVNTLFTIKDSSSNALNNANVKITVNGTKEFEYQCLNNTNTININTKSGDTISYLVKKVGFVDESGTVTAGTNTVITMTENASLDLTFDKDYLTTDPYGLLKNLFGTWGGERDTTNNNLFCVKGYATLRTRVGVDENKDLDTRTTYARGYIEIETPSYATVLTMNVNQYCYASNNYVGIYLGSVLYDATPENITRADLPIIKSGDTYVNEGQWLYHTNQDNTTSYNEVIVELEANKTYYLTFFTNTYSTWTLDSLNVKDINIKKKES